MKERIEYLTKLSVTKYRLVCRSLRRGNISGAKEIIESLTEIARECSEIHKNTRDIEHQCIALDIHGWAHWLKCNITYMENNRLTRMKI